MDVPFTIAANSLRTFVDVTLCGDTRIESAQEIVCVALVSVFGANCASIGCVAAGLIIEDHAPGFITIDSLTLSRCTFGTTLAVPVRLSVPYGLPESVDFTTTLQGGGKVGVFSLGADEARINVGDTAGYALQWTLPPGRVWRELGNIGVRLRSANKSLLWLNWNESSSLFSQCQRRGVRVGSDQFYGQGSEVDADDDDQDKRQALAVTCSAGALPSSSTVLRT